MSVTRWAAQQALVNAFKAITGGSVYNTDLGSRVYTRFLTPLSAAAPKSVFACVPLAGDAEAPDWDNLLITSKWKQTAYFYVPDPSSSDIDSDVDRLLSNLRDDVYHALLVAGPTLGGTVRNVSILGLPIWGPVAPGDWGELQVELELTQIFQASDLVP